MLTPSMYANGERCKCLQECFAVLAILFDPGYGYGKQCIVVAIITVLDPQIV